METDRKALETLLERVRAAKGRDPELDAAIGCAFIHRELRPSECGDHGEREHWRGYITGRHGFLLAQNYTGSVDAALKLVERMLPGWGGRVSFSPVGSTARLWHLVDATKIKSTDGATPALAIIAALLTALSNEASDA